ncbi:MAG TPA: PAS domain S-box protein [Candidatus Omnitrophota bacterium]|nr:PAS domain S-box protein [Candidatus Omnitrophota bacterium]
MKEPKGLKLEKAFFIFPVTIFLITLFSGILLAGLLGNVGATFLRLQSENTVAAIGTGIRNDLQQGEAAGGAMVGSPWIVPALIDPSPSNIEKANSVLDRYNKNLNFSVCYLLDLQGNAIASSNRNDPDSFVGKNYAFRPYFHEAVLGNPMVYMATGVTSRERGFYASHPVRDGQGRIVGISVIKKNVEAVKALLLNSKNIFFVSPEGVIFISGSPDKVLRPLWPLSEERLRKIKDSKQFLLASEEPVFPDPVQDGATVRLEKESYQFIQRPLGPQGWSLVFLAPLKSVFYYQFLGWVIAGFMAIIIIFLTVWALLRIRARETLREIEERFSSAFRASGSGMAIVSLEGRWLQVNPSLCRIVGYTEKELLLKTFQEVTHPDDLERNLAYVKRLLAGDIQDYRIEKRYMHKDGHFAWVLVSKSVVRGSKGEPLYFVAQIEDISDRKAAEKKLEEQVKELEKFNKIAVDRELKMIELKEKIKTLEKGKQNG